MQMPTQRQWQGEGDGSWSKAAVRLLPGAQADNVFIPSGNLRKKDGVWKCSFPVSRSAGRSMYDTISLDKIPDS